MRTGYAGRGHTHAVVHAGFGLCINLDEVEVCPVGFNGGYWFGGIGG